MLISFGQWSSGQALWPASDADPNPQGAVQAGAADAMWDLQFVIDADSITGGTGLAGAECTGTHFFAVEWGSSGHNTIFKLDMSGNYVDSISTSFTGSTSGIRDLAWDGQYLYGGLAGTTIYCFDVNGTLITTITSPVNVRAIAYDEVNDAFWVNNWSDNLVLLSRSGVILDTIATPPSIYGMAYDNVSTGGPYLWLFSGTSSAAGTCQVEQWNIATGLATGVTHSVSGDLGSGIAGGLFTQPNIVPGKFTLGGLMQTALDIFGYEIADIGAGYCPAAGGCDEYISNVMIGSSINNTSTCSQYHDYTNLVAPVNIGVPFNVAVTNGNPYNGDQCGIWVDWNQNEDFSDDSVVTVVGSGGLGPYTATIIPPAGALTGQTRIRIRITYTGAFGPCDTLTYGEVEDYTLLVSNVAQVDAGVASILPLGSNAGNHPVQVKIMNYGLDTLTSTTIGFSINGQAGTTTNWTGSLAPLAMSDTIVLDSSVAFPQGNNTITAWTTMPNGVQDGNTANDSISSTFYLFGSISTFPYAQGFETGLGNWQQPTIDDFDWTRQSGPTTSLTTGPTAAIEGAYYMYTESSSPRVVGDEAMLDCAFDMSNETTLNLKFWYHMYGASQGTLHLDIHADSLWHTDVWSMTGDQGDVWYEATVPLDTIACGHDDVIIRFRGTLGADPSGTVFWSDMAVDHVTIFVPQANDVGIFNILEPVSGWLTASDSVKVVVRNFGTTPQSNFSVSYQVDSGIVVTDTITSSIAGNSDLTHTFSATANLGTVGQTYDVKAWTSLAGDADPTNDTMMISVTNNTGQYCAASGGGDEFISNVNIGTINNTSVASGYMDYTALSTDITIGNPLLLTVTNGNPYSADQCGVWIDWNHNGIFDDDPVSVMGTPGNGPYTALITPPATADTGATRMRIRIRYTGVLSPCGTTLYGEVEDYTLNVKPGVSTDVGVFSIDMLAAIGAGPVVPVATVRNFGSMPQTFNVQMNIGTYSQTETVTNLAPYSAQQVSFPSWNATAGNYTIEVFTQLSGDLVPGNDTMNQLIVVAAGATRARGLLEEFTSSTCAPCASFHTSTFNPWLNMYADSVTLIKYQMNWPGAGDPYYTAEGGVRRTYYGVNAVPDLFWQGTPSAMTSAGLTSQLTALAGTQTFWEISGTANTMGNLITVDMDILPYVSGPLTAHMVVIEKITTGNVGSNGETQFKNVMMKMLPNANGSQVNLTSLQTHSLSLSADLTNTNVEQLSDLRVVMFLQDNVTKTVVQSAYTDVIVGTSDQWEENLALFPNPSTGLVRLYGAENAEVRVFNALGAEVFATASFQGNTLNLGHLPSGSYFVKITTAEGSATRKLVLID